MHMKQLLYVENSKRRAKTFRDGEGEIETEVYVHV